MALEFDDVKNRVIVNPKDLNRVVIEEQVNHISISTTGPQGITGPTGPTGATGEKGRYTVSETEPVNPQVGDAWFKSSTAQMYLRYDGFWVETSTSYLGPTGATGPQGPQGPAIDLTSVSSNIIPTTTNTYTLGSTTKRWKDVYIGPGTINITDSVTGNNAGITISNSIFQINGIAQAQLPNIKVTNLTFNDNTVQTTAYVPGTIAIRTPATGNTLTIDLSTDTYVHQHINQGNLSITLTNPTAGRTVEVLLMWGTTGGGSISINDISGSNISNGSNGFAITKQFNSIRFYCIASNFTETFAVVSIS